MTIGDVVLLHARTMIYTAGLCVDVVV